MKIELKNIKHAEFASQETNCFSATIYLDGKKAGTVENDGHGGCNNYHPWQIEKQINDYAKTLPKAVSKHITDPNTGRPMEYDQDADTLIDDLLVDWLLARDLKKCLKKQVLFTKPGVRGLFASKNMPAGALQHWLSKPEETRNALHADQILNLLPPEKALEIYKREAA